MTRVSSRAAIGAGRDVSGAVTGVAIRYVRRRAGQTGVKRLLAWADDNRAPRSLEDPTSWSSLDQTVALFDSAARILHDPEVARHLGEALLDQFRGTEVEGLLQRTKSPEGLLRSAMASFGRLSPIAIVEVLEAHDGRAVVRTSARRGFTRHIYMCDLQKGFLTDVPTFFGSGRATVTETECQARGGPFCLYEVEWVPETESHELATGDTSSQQSSITQRRSTTDEPVTGPRPEQPEQPEQPVEQVAASRLEAQVVKLSERLEEAYSTAAELLVTESINDVLERIAGRAARAVNSPRHLLVVRISDGSEIEIHSKGLREDERSELASRLLALHEHSLGTDVLVVDIESARNHYGRMAAFAPVGGFESDDRQVLSSYASYAAAALDVLTALDQARRSNESASALIGFSRALAGVETVDEVAQRLAETVPLVAGCDRSTVMLWNPEEQALTVRAATGPGAEALLSAERAVMRAGYRVEREATTLFDRVLDSHELLVVDLDTDNETIRSVLVGTGTACAVIAPLATSDQFFGIVTANFDAVPAKDPRSDTELHTRMIGLADHAVTAMQNTQLLEQVTHLAWHDSLTALPNRRLLEDRVNQDLERARRNGESTCMFFIDLDRLKQVNDTFGHAAGDELIRDVAGRLVDTVRRQDTVARLGGDEFAVLLPGLADLGDIDTLARRTLEALRRPYMLAGNVVNVSGSIGVAVAPGHGETYDDLLSNADAAMYRAKALGRDTYQMYSVPEGGARPDVQLEVDLKHAVERSEMSVLYQPVVDMRTSEFIAVEALARWQHPVRGVLPPDVFLALATDPEVIAGLDSWVVSEACRQIASWTESGLDRMQVSVNVASRSLAFDGFVPAVESALRSWRVDPGLIELEVSDLGALEADGPARRSVDRLVTIGVRFAVDDVKTVSVASSRIGSVPISTLKLDRSFVHLVGEDPETAALVAAIVSLTSSHGIRCIAEGVETQAQARSLLSQGCVYAQGFLFSPPLLPSDVEQMLVGGDPRREAPGSPERPSAPAS
jgi:diguanylate cyclase (GGDEF)-like protein